MEYVVYDLWCIVHGIWEFPKIRSPYMVCVYIYILDDIRVA